MTTKTEKSSERGEEEEELWGGSGGGRNKKKNVCNTDKPTNAGSSGSHWDGDSAVSKAL